MNIRTGAGIAALFEEPEIERQCKRCTAPFLSRCRSAKYCPNCRKAIKLERPARVNAARKAQRKAGGAR